ncbi:bifunctional 5,10-methylenetetrahydrofolate dehydrogenase/5,10-methenyltetrahydrofolate cyclohydrolase [Pseudonocardia abyssalis]|uniref:Bifunctional protein FolD n=1 Tax=Pseudonocardia abyssalis TaxID=2792008 RepID=A0ABS6UPC2_9PSEU|nr:tetrahydrofolate dehydrogenase/cyclohydrolase catalytic domain-containing protein [Pseudonocardia abyssalis]MBW0115107.1 bifunctional 5,10-methylene-tetrahydrofolate dehydrogenase/5,10-methylene-tetrahydrofolate cyclohydrolase [Pseudonocardia abyssalis]MBW0133753.1 bifunctional 5,10-methylene-tetrahydrofolate dehydrogenase/5,10-methylene-tetrahydrofolate cyclohydrolase [Pseudonocardia abyssalis]
MTARVMDGRACARALAAGLADEVARLRDRGGRPGLAIVSAGSDHGAALYGRRLQRLSAEFGIGHAARPLPATATQADLLGVIAELNADPDLSGILVLRPLPPHVDESAVFRALDPAKDVEAVHPENAGLLTLGVPRFVPSTPAAVFHLLDTWLDAAGEDRADFYHRSRIVVVGRSNTVGKPAVALGCAREASVESVDVWADRTGGLGRHTRWADVLVVAAGRPGLIRAEHVTPGAIVIDVGINASTGSDGRVRTVGDVDAASVAPRAGALSPVPGGVGPVTDVWLLRSTVRAASLRPGSDRTLLEVP